MFNYEGAARHIPVSAKWVGLPPGSNQPVVVVPQHWAQFLAMDWALRDSRDQSVARATRILAECALRLWRIESGEDVEPANPYLLAAWVSAELELLGDVPQEEGFESWPLGGGTDDAPGSEVEEPEIQPDGHQKAEMRVAYMRDRLAARGIGDDAFSPVGLGKPPQWLLCQDLDDNASGDETVSPPDFEIPDCFIGQHAVAIEPLWVHDLLEAENRVHIPKQEPSAEELRKRQLAANEPVQI
jgi:hypothetical protein